METKKKQGSPTYQEERFRVVAFLGVTTKGTREGGGSYLRLIPLITP